MTTSIQDTNKQTCCRCGSILTSEMLRRFACTDGADSYYHCSVGCENRTQDAILRSEHNRGAVDGRNYRHY